MAISPTSGFTYNNKPYTLRYQQDTSWLSSGDRIVLLYHPGTDVFRQPRTYSAFKDNNNQSKLMKFTIISFGMMEGNGWWLVCSSVPFFVLLLSGLLATLTGSTIVRTAGRIVFIALLLAGVAYLTYNTWQYYRYYNQLKSGAHEETVQVLSTWRRNTSRRSNWFYAYEATVQHGKQERVIPIGEEEYRILKPGAPLQVYYNSQLNDMMSINHSPDHANLLATLFAWVLLLYFTRQQWLKIRNKPRAQPLIIQPLSVYQTAEAGRPATAQQPIG